MNYLRDNKPFLALRNETTIVQNNEKIIAIILARGFESVSAPIARKKLILFSKNF